MKHPICFYNHYKALNKTFQKHFINAQGKFDSNNIHQLRVTIKKIKAFFHLVEYVNHDFDASKSFHYYKRIFKQAGKVRDLQVQLLLLNKLENELKITLSVQQDAVIKKGKKEYRNFRKYSEKINPAFNSKVNKHVHKAVDSEFLPVRTKEYLLIQAKHIMNLIIKYKHDNKDLHKIRMMLKDYMYNMVLVNDCTLNNKRITKHISKINDLQDIIGRWHDEGAMLSFASSYKPHKHFTASDNKTMHVLQRRMQQSIRQLESKIRRRFSILLEDFTTIAHIF